MVIGKMSTVLLVHTFYYNVKGRVKMTGRMKGTHNGRHKWG